MNDFDTDLKWSLDTRDDDFLNEFYIKKFPHIERIENVESLELQKKGIDKIFHIAGGKTIFIDEKKRRKAWPDIALEEYSDYEKRKIGWMSKGKYTDYIMYIFIPTQTIYILPFLLLQSSWLKNYKKWAMMYKFIYAKNKNYTTRSLAIPIVELLNALKAEMHDTFELMGEFRYK